MSRFLPCALIAGTLVFAATPSFATGQTKTSSGQNANKAISSVGTVGFIGLGLLLPLIQDGDQGWAHTLRVADAGILSAGVAFGLENLTHEPKPNGLHRDSFPSMHATVAFEVATMQSSFHPWEAPLWYAGAAVISVSRVQLREHHWGDVFAGAVLGFGTAKLELSCTRGILIYPLMNADGGVGIAMNARF